MSAIQRLRLGVTVCVFTVLGCKLFPGQPNERIDHHGDVTYENGESSLADWQALSSEQLMAKIEMFCSTAFQREVADIHSSGTPIADDHSPKVEEVFNLRDAATGEKIDVVLDVRVGTVLAYFAETSTESMQKAEKQVAPAISREEAFELAKPVLRWYNLPMDRDEYIIRADELSVPPARWSVRRQHTYKGVACRAKDINVLVSRYVPKVITVMYTPITKPTRHVVAITEGEALRNAERWMEGVREIKEDGIRYEFAEDLGEVEKVITHPLDIPLRGVEKAQARGFSPRETYYAWSVPVALFVGERQIKWFVYVDTESGKIITCGDKKDSRPGKSGDSRS